MDANPLLPPLDDRTRLARALLLLQAGIVATAAVEATVFGGASANALSLGVLNTLALVWTLLLRHRVSTGSTRSWTWVRRTQTWWIAFAAMDALLALWLADRFLEPVPLATRLLLPFVIRRLASTAVGTASTRTRRSISVEVSA